MRAPLPLYGPTGKPLKRSYAGGGHNQMVPSAWNQNGDRRTVPFLDRDFRCNVSALGRRTLLSLGRRIWGSCDAVRGAMQTNAELIGASLVLDYRGKSERFKSLVEELLYQHDRWLDVEGWNWTMLEYRLGLLSAIWTDGDQGTILVERDGLPYIQVIPSHRIGCDCEEVTGGGPYDGRKIHDGVIVDEYGAPIAYRVLKGDGSDYSQFEDVSADSMFLSFIPFFRGQLRGLSLLGLSGWNFQDLEESKRFELLAQKAGAGRVFQEWNETGEAPLDANYITGPDSGATTSRTPSGLWKETIDGGITAYFKENTNQRVEAVKFDRPSSNQQAYVKQVTREGFTGSRLSVDLLLDLTNLNGGPLRLLVDIINNTRQLMQTRLCEPAARRIDMYRIPKFMQAKWLPQVNDFYQIEYHGPPRLTADKKYDSDVDGAEMRTGVKTRTRAAAERGEALADIRNIKEAEVRDLLKRAKGIAEEFGITIEAAKSMLEEDSLNGQTQPMTPQATEADPSADSDAIKARLDAYGVGVRAGAFTPTIEDERALREEAGLPALTSEAEDAWGKEDKVRRPITLTPLPGQQARPSPVGAPQEGDEDE